MPDAANITTQGSCDHMIKEPTLQTLDEDVMRTKELVSGSASQETSNRQEQLSHMLHKVSVLEKEVESDLAGPADMEVDEDSNTAKSVNTELEGKAEREEPSTSQQTRAEREEPSTSQQTRAEREEPSTSQQTRAEREEPSTSQQTRAEREEPSTSQQTRAERKRKLPTDVGKISNSEGYTSAKR